MQCHQEYGMGNPYYYFKQIEDLLLSTIPPFVKIKCSVKQVMRAIIRLLKLNLFQCAILTQLLNNSGYNIDEISTEGLDQTSLEDSKLSRYILLRGYHVKKQLADIKIIEQIDKQIYQSCKVFKRQYEKWKQKRSINLNLKQLNRIFENWKQKRYKNIEVDYNDMVNKILGQSRQYLMNQNQQQSEQMQHKKQKKAKKIKKQKIVIDNQKDNKDEKFKRDIKDKRNKKLNQGPKDDLKKKQISKPQKLQKFNKSNQYQLRSRNNLPPSFSILQNIFTQQRSMAKKISSSSKKISSSSKKINLSNNNKINQLEQPVNKTIFGSSGQYVISRPILRFSNGSSMQNTIKRQISKDQI